MIRPNESVTRALVALENDTNWNEIVEWISASLTEQSIENNKSSGETTVKGQGRNLELIDLLKHINSAYQYMKNAHETRHKGE